MMTPDLFEPLTHRIAEGFLRDTQALIDLHGPLEGQLRAREGLTMLAEAVLKGGRLLLPTGEPMSDLMMKAVACEAMRAAVLLKAPEGTVN
jgi:hypothetical protein